MMMWAQHDIWGKAISSESRKVPLMSGHETELIGASESFKTSRYPNLDSGTSWNSWLHTLALGAVVGCTEDLLCVKYTRPPSHRPTRGPWASWEVGLTPSTAKVRPAPSGYSVLLTARLWRAGLNAVKEPYTLSLEASRVGNRDWAKWSGVLSGAPNRACVCCSAP